MCCASRVIVLIMSLISRPTYLGSGGIGTAGIQICVTLCVLTGVRAGMVRRVWLAQRLRQHFKEQRVSVIGLALYITGSRAKAHEYFASASGHIFETWEFWNYWQLWYDDLRDTTRIKEHSCEQLR